MSSFSLEKTFLIVFFTLYLTIGFIIYPDFGICVDEPINRQKGDLSLNYVLNNLVGDSTHYPGGVNNYLNHYGVAFLLPLSFMERVFGLTEINEIYLFRHFATFLLFYISSIFFYFLCRIFLKDWRYAFISTFFLIVYPRIFAESFFNPKDLPLLSFFIISIYGLFSYIKRPCMSWLCFNAIFCGLTVGVRLQGLLAPALTVFALIFIAYMDRDFKSHFKHFCIFLFLAGFFIVLFRPFLWEDPINRFILSFETMSNFRWGGTIRHLGVVSGVYNIPWHYLPINFMITVPPLYQILFIAGLAFYIYGFSSRKNKFLHGDVFFLVILMWTFAPYFISIILKSTTYNVWRHFYFTYPGFCLIAGYGFKKIHEITRPHLSNLVILIFLSQILYISHYMYVVHPLYHVYFNFIGGETVYRNFTNEYWQLSVKNAYDYLLERESGDIYVNSTNFQLPARYNTYLYPESERKRIKLTNDSPDYILTSFLNRVWPGYVNIKNISSQNNVLIKIMQKDGNVSSKK